MFGGDIGQKVLTDISVKKKLIKLRFFAMNSVIKYLSKEVSHFES